jgi:hypothetical protein
MSKRKKPSEGGDYEVGYGRPPEHSRFKKGTSGNPQGRPRKTDNSLAAILAEALGEKVSVREGANIRRMSKLEMLVQAALSAAMKGDARARGDLLMLLIKTGQLGTAAPHAASPVLVVPGTMDLEDWLAAAEKQQAPYRGNNGE